MTRSLDQVVTAVAAELMAANAANRSAHQRTGAGRSWSATSASTSASCATTTTPSTPPNSSREWPPRPYIPDPDPIGVVYFADADPVFAAAEHLKTPLVIRPEPANDDYQRRIEEGTAVPASLDGLRAAAVRGDHHRRRWASSSSATANGRRTNSTRCRRSPPCSPSCRPASWPRSSCTISPSTTT